MKRLFYEDKPEDKPEDEDEINHDKSGFASIKIIKNTPFASQI